MWQRMSLFILIGWAFTSWETCKRLPEPLLFKCSNRRGASSGTPARSLAHCLSYANLPVATPFKWCLCFLTKVAMRRGASEYSAVYLSIHLELASPSALFGSMPMIRTLLGEKNLGGKISYIFKTTFYRHNKIWLPHAPPPWLRVWVHSCHWSCMQRGQGGGSKTAKLSSNLIIICASSAQRIYSFYPGRPAARI